jgi:signal transduction histidine kinase
MKYDFKAMDLNDLVKSVIEELKQNVEKKGLKLTYECDTTKTYLVNVDSEKIKQVLMNIIDNSAKYTPKGEVKVSLTKNSSGKTLFAVKDTGIGISKDTIPKLFAKFIRAKNANETNIRGTGLGLFIAKEIITAHEGKIWVESEGEGKGSQFYVELAEKKS